MDYAEKICAAGGLGGAGGPGAVGGGFDGGGV